jgi:hypothetical protein
VARHTLYAYVEGKELHEVAGLVVQRVMFFIRKTRWRYGKPRLVDQERSDQFELGLNYDLPDSPQEPSGWFDDIERIALFCAELRTATGRNFVIGVGDNTSGVTEDLFHIESGNPDLQRLREIIGVAE